MKVLEILERVCVYLDLTEEFEKVLNEEGFGEDVINDYEKIILSINNLSEDLSYSILKNKTSEEVNFVNNLFDMTSLTKRVIGIKEVKSLSGKKLKYELSDNMIECNVTNAIVTYYYAPKQVYNLRDEVFIDPRISFKAFVLGVVSEYFYINGLLDDYKVYQEKFLNALGETRKKTNIRLPKRRWF